jgi:hypothetical protein
MISDGRLLAYFSAFGRPSSGTTPQLPSIRPSSSFLRYISNPLSLLPLPSLNLYSEVVAVHSGNSVVDAMRMMSDLGVSSVAVLDEEGGALLSAISVTDIGQVGEDHAGTICVFIDEFFAQTVVPSESNQILTMPIQQLVSQIKVRSRLPCIRFPNPSAFQMPHGWTDGADRYPGLPFFLSLYVECSYATKQYTACSRPPR